MAWGLSAGGCAPASVAELKVLPRVQKAGAKIQVMTRAAAVYPGFAIEEAKTSEAGLPERDGIRWEP